MNRPEEYPGKPEVWRSVAKGSFTERDTLTKV